MNIYRDQDADLGLLEGRRIAVLGYGNQGRAQALNLRDSGLQVVVGNREDPYADRARADGFSLLPIDRAAEQADVVLLLVPDEVAPAVFESQIAPHLVEGDVLVFASGFNVTFGLIAAPSHTDVVLVAPRMIGAGVRERFVSGLGFPAFIGVAQNHSGQAREVALSLARGIGATRMGVVEVTFAQETELDLFTEQCFGPAFGHVLTTAVDLLLEEGYPPEAVLLELYMSGELAYTLGKIAELGIVEQTALHSPTSQYGSMSRGMRFMLPELRARMQAGLEEIRSGAFAQEWAEEQGAGYPTLTMLQEAARALPLHSLEQELRQALRSGPQAPPAQMHPEPSSGWGSPSGEPDGAPSGPDPSGSKLGLAKDPSPSPAAVQPDRVTPEVRGRGALQGLLDRLAHRPDAPSPQDHLDGQRMRQVLAAFIDQAANDPALREFAQGRRLTIHYRLSDLALDFYMAFEDGVVAARLGSPLSEAQVHLTAQAVLLDGILTGQTNAMRAAMTGKLSFDGDARQAMAMQSIQDDLVRLYTQARQTILAGHS